jgi:toxin-antitoxin system PIN domain toxin
VTVLLDANVLIALVVDDHVHHDAAEAWFADTTEPIATCPITQGSLLRLLIRGGQSAATAQAVVSAIVNSPRHEFWPDDVSYGNVSMMGVIGHRQVTDAYLAQLARTRNGRLATFDQGLAKLHNDIADIVPIGG